MADSDRNISYRGRIRDDLRFRGPGEGRAAAAAAAAASRSSPAGPAHQIAPTPLRLRRAPRSHSRRAAPLLVARTRRRRRRRRGKGEGRKPGSAAAAGGGVARRRRSRWSYSRRCRSRRSLPAVGPGQCPFLSPIVNITRRLSPWHTRNRTSELVAPAPDAHPLDTSNGKHRLIGRHLPSLLCQHDRLRADLGLAAGGGPKTVGREEAEDWAGV
ncbi:PREDICTED: uncharacterized protein LOC106150141 [Chinchilla lanigera]|uniref:uncharacterized protein LOC106150141 n=1 Tax=Chinchilla lanigera TaxID=34839 RepID=UPI0006974166|nr:PREDICTED: uncharacterized protein LOC106150141 [Chinchilla lanigera]